MIQTHAVLITPGYINLNLFASQCVDSDSKNSEVDEINVFNA